MKKILMILGIGLLISCSTTLKLQIMPRDEGTFYNGTVQGNGRGTGTITLTIKEKTCSGPYARSSSGESVGLIQTYGSNGKSSLGTVVSSGGGIVVKAILSCTDGTGVRCDFVGQNGAGTGVCVDTNGKIFDAVVGNL